MNQIQNWFINSRKRFLGPLKLENDKDDDSRNLDSIHQSLPIISKNSSFMPTLMFQQQPPTLLCPKAAQKPQNPVIPHLVHYDEKDPTIALNIEEGSTQNDKSQQPGMVDPQNFQNQQNEMYRQMNEIQNLWIKTNPIVSYYNQMIMKQFVIGASNNTTSASSIGSFGVPIMPQQPPNIAPHVPMSNPQAPDCEILPAKMRSLQHSKKNLERLNRMIQRGEDDGNGGN